MEKKGGANSGDIAIIGSQLKAGGDTALDAERDLLLSAAANTEKIEGSKKSSGGNIGVSVGVGQNTGFSVFANANSSRGSENGDSTLWHNATVDSGGKITLHSGRDTTLKGAQVNGEQITADVGRNLSLQSLQDIEHYESQQTSVSGGVSVPIGAGSGSASASASRDKVNSHFQSVKEQTGLFAGKGGYDIKVKEHTQLDGAVIASSAEQDNNMLDTGTLGWSDIHNQADFTAEHSGGSLSSGGPVGTNLMNNMAGGVLAGANSSGHAEGTTQAAVSQGRLIIRQQDNQQQDIAQLSRDTDNANGSIEPIFDKEKEQRRLQQAQLIGDIGNQTMDIIRTQGDIAGLKQAKSMHPTLTAEALRETKEYREAMMTYGTGSDLQKAAQALTGALTALAGNNLAGALASGASPYLATEIKNRGGEENVAANAMAHAALGALTAQLNNQSALAGGLGAASGELAAQVITQQLFPGKKPDQLSESEKQQISTLSQLVSGLAGGLAISDTQGVVTGAQAGKNAVENNFLNGDEARAFEKEWQACQASGGDCGAVVDKYADINRKNNEELQQVCEDSPLTCASYQKQLVDTGMDAATRPEWMPDWFGAPIRDEEIRGVVQTENAKALEHIHKSTDKWDRLGSFVAEPENVLGLAGTAKSAFTKSSTITAKATGAAMSLGASAGVQVLEGKTGDKFDYMSFFTSGLSGIAGVGKSLNSNVRLNVGGAYLSSQVTGENSQAAMMGAAAGSAVGYGMGAAITRPWEAKLVKEHFGMTASKNALKYSDSAFGPGYLFKDSKLSSIPGISGGFVGAGTSEVSNSFVQGDIRKEKE
ncbi:hemagglutinin repeat-containing protein [Acerihabitans sp. KWT182]|uniref:Hemagglutinin repeat-containing protein n=1 Tax=Acerihabitans sp. KWT182 TaxID=3157919 RepID=A0AAU7Q8X9_9GAMM